jgi:hypothetical protein
MPLNMLQKLSIKWCDRVAEQDLKGKRRDSAMVEYFCGAAQALQLTEHPEADHVLRVLAMVFCTRGHSEAEKIAREAEKAVNL